MSRIGSIALLLVLMVVSRLAAETITVATYNVENYLAADRMVDGAYRQDYPKPEEAKQALRTVIREMGADILVIQEMGSRPYLDELQRDLAKEGLKYPFAELLVAADADRHLAVLSRRPFASVRGHTDLTFTYFGSKETVKRGLLELRVATEAGELTLFVVHLKSRFTDRQDDPLSALRRLGEATAVRDRVLTIFSDPAKAQFLVLGDCNDSGASKPVRALAQRGKTVIAEALLAADSRGEVWTHFYRKEQSYSAVDHVLVSPSLKSHVANGSATIVDVPVVGRASDHRPVLVRLKMDNAAVDGAK
ncbi:MAG: endonuclease/exonuclease/phosphatase family protein [Nibricoccus sp.]